MGWRTYGGAGMKLFLENWRKYIKETEINEVTEEELSDISQILMDLKPSDLPFGSMFNDKMRLMEPMKSRDSNLDYLKKILKKSGYQPDLSTGLATYHVVTLPGGVNTKGEPIKPSSMILGSDQLHVIQKKDDETEEKYKERMKIIRKKEVKIGKLLQKGGRLFDIAKKTYNEFESVNPTDYPEDEYSKYRQKSMELEDEVEKATGKLQDVFPEFTSSPRRMDVNPFQTLASWWNKKSTFYRENPEAAEEGTTTGEYSVIYTRHPIDILRMSDFDSIESCHSPKSRGGQSEYYKCAVAEAHDGGIIAYIVKDADIQQLKKWVVKYENEGKPLTDQEFLDTYQADDNELFYDKERSDESGELRPISRVRLKQYKNPSAEVTLAVPEMRIYGKKFPGFRETVRNWAKTTQAKEIKKLNDTKNSDNPYESAFDEDGTLDLSRWERYGGTYQDTDDSGLFYALLGYNTIGRAHIDKTTEDNLELNSSVIPQWEAQVEETINHWNDRYQAMQVSAHVEEYDGEAFIPIAATYVIRIDEDEFVESAFQADTRTAIENLPSELIDYGYSWLKDYVNYSVGNQGVVVIEIAMDISDATDDSEAAYSPDHLHEICAALDAKDDQADAIWELAKNALKREGILEGGALFQLARALWDESWYEWDYEIDDEYNPDEIEAETKVYVDFSDLIKQIPVTFSTQLRTPSRSFTADYDGEPIAYITPLKDANGELKAYRVVSPEFQPFGEAAEPELASKEAILEYVQQEIAKLILRPGGKGTRIPKGWEASRDYNIAVKQLMREHVGGVEGQFDYPESATWVHGPDSDGDYKIMFSMNVNDRTPDKTVKNAHEIVTEADDEDILTAIFKKAFAKVAKIDKGLNEVRAYFRKFDDILFD